MNKKGYTLSLIGGIGYLVFGVAWLFFGIFDDYSNFWWILSGITIIINAIAFISKIVSANKENTAIEKGRGAMIFYLVFAAIISLALLFEGETLYGLVPLIGVLTAILGLIGLKMLKAEVSRYWEENRSNINQEVNENENE